MAKAIVKAKATAIEQVVDAKSVVEEWLSEHRSENTRKAYARDLMDFCRTIYRTDDYRKALSRFLSLSEIEAGLVLTKFKAMLRERGLKAASINRKLSSVKALIDLARRRGLVTWRIADLVRGEKERTDQKERVRMRLPATSADGLLDALNRIFAGLPKKGVRALRDRAIVALMALHGLRRIEIVRLSLSDLTEGDSIMTIRIWGKSDKFRVIPLRKDTTELLRRYLSALKRAGIEPVPDAIGVPVFVSLRKGKGCRLNWRQVNNIVDSALQRAGLKRQGISCHSLRHTFATLAATEVPLPELAAYLGHSSIATTGVYAHALNTVNPSMAIKVKAL